MPGLLIIAANGNAVLILFPVAGETTRILLMFVEVVVYIILGDDCTLIGTEATFPCGDTFLILLLVLFTLFACGVLLLLLLLLMEELDNSLSDLSKGTVIA